MNTGRMRKRTGNVTFFKHGYTYEEDGVTKTFLLPTCQHEWGAWEFYVTRHGNPDYGPEKQGEKRYCSQCKQTDHRNVTPYV